MDINITINIQRILKYTRKQIELGFWTRSGQYIIHWTSNIMNKLRGTCWRIKHTKGGQKHWSDDINM